MSKKPAKSGQLWTASDEAKLNELARRDTSTPEIARRLARTQEAVYKKASELNVSLMPKDK